MSMMRCAVGLCALFASTAPVAAQPEAARFDWWREARLGLFVHWGPVSLKGTEIGWSRGGERRGHGGRGPIPATEYDALYRRFEPQDYDAREWVRIAKAMGAGYIVLTTKHHDGFCLFDSERTDYKITNAPIGRDLVRELADACHEGGMRLGFYYSQPDWHHPDYRSDRHRRYVDYLHAQVRELLTNYGRVDVLWFDGLGGKAEDWHAERLFATIRALQPQILVNNRCGLPGDFDTPEQRLGRFQIERPWESCITIGTQWAWKPNDRIKSLATCVQTLVGCAGRDGNLLLNVGPMPSGAIEARQVARLREIGTWLERNGETVRGTRGGPVLPAEWGVSTHRGDRVFLHVFDWSDGPLRIPTARLPVREARLFGGEALALRRDGEVLLVDVPTAARDPIDTIVELRLERPAAGIEAFGITPRSLALGAKARASNVFRGQARFGADKICDGDPSTRWATDAGTESAWIELDLGEPRRFGSVRIRECCDYGQRVAAFALQCEVAGEWRTVHEGQGLGERHRGRFTPVTAQRVRLVISKASEGPTIRELELFER